MTVNEPASAQPAGPLKECDLIMKGGITSGVIYPRAAVKLSNSYRFKQVGGASAGAIAAAFVAAAEHGRHRPARAPGDSQQTGFEGLEQISSQLGSQLSTLFQPVPSTKAAFGILSAWIDPAWGKLRKIGVTVWRLLRNSPVVAVVVFVLAMLPGVAVAASLQHGADWPHWWTPRRSWVVWMPGSFLLALLSAAVSTSMRTVRAMNDNGFGLCNGHIGTDPKHQPLTDWMSDALNQLAGRTATDGPLLFGHLWGSLPPSSGTPIPPSPLGDVDKTAKNHRDVDLHVMTTCLTLRRPYRFPFSSDVFFACRACMTSYFPPDVVTALFPDIGPAAQEDEDWCCPLHPEHAVRHLPPAEHLPVVVAARISLSFPGLISAVPLCYRDFSRPDPTEQAVVAWFSDGGIASNFPMHLFDTMWPSRPTFGINLQPVDPDHPDMVWMPQQSNSGWLPRASKVTSVGQFVSSILDTMQNWSDTTQLSIPGYRDRVVEVRTTGAEGGMNLKMKPDTIDGLGARGSAAASLLLETFDFEQHRWNRYRVAMNLLDSALTTMHESYASMNDEPGYQQFIADFGPRTANYAMGVGARADDAEATEQLMAAVGQWIAANHPATADAPRIQASLRSVPLQ